MFQMKFWAVAMLLAVVGYALPLQAENPPGQNAPAAVDREAGQGGMMIRSDSLIGSKVLDTKGERLGTVHDIVLTPDHKKISYVVLSHGGAVGIGDKYFAVPLSALQIKTKEQSKVDSVVLDVSKDVLSRNQGFDKKNWPSGPDMNLFKVEGMGSREAMSGQGQVSKYQKVRELEGLNVKNDQSQKLGDISYLILDTQQSMVPFAVVSFGGVLGVNEKFAAVPWGSIQIQENNNVAILPTTKEKLESVAFTRDRFPDFSSREYAMKVYQNFGAQPYWEAGGPTARVTAVSFEAWKPDSDYNKMFDAQKVTTVNGSIESVSTFYPVDGAAPGLLLKIKTDSGETLMIHGGPVAYVDSKNLHFASGDKITVTGSQVEFKGEKVLMASEIKKGNDTLMLRDKDGKIQWDINQLQKSEKHEGHEGMDSK